MKQHTVKQKQYCITIDGHLDPCWQEWFDDLTITHTESGHTTLNGVLVDQSALHGVLRKIHNLGLTLISVNPQ